LPCGFSQPNIRWNTAVHVLAVLKNMIFNALSHSPKMATRPLLAILPSAAFFASSLMAFSMESTKHCMGYTARDAPIARGSI